MNSCELITLISSIACTIAKTVSQEELALVGAAFSQLGDTLTTMALHNDICSRRTEEK